MNSLVYIVASRFDWNTTFFDKFSEQQKGMWYFASNPSELDKLLESYNPRYIFFPHWSWIVPKEIFEKYECVCFHMTDLPFGRGGSPLCTARPNISFFSSKNNITKSRAVHKHDTSMAAQKPPVHTHRRETSHRNK